jgi:hypothetical protein
MSASCSLGAQLRLPAAGALRRASGARAAACVLAAPRAEYTTSLRPYTIRKGDTLDSIAKKRGLEVKDLNQYNKNLSAKGARCARAVGATTALRSAGCCVARSARQLRARARALTRRARAQAARTRARPSCCPRSSCLTCAHARAVSPQTLLRSRAHARFAGAHAAHVRAAARPQPNAALTRHARPWAHPDAAPACTRTDAPRPSGLRLRSSPRSATARF